MEFIIVTTTVQLPTLPPHLVMTDGQLLPLDAITDDGLQEIGSAYGHALVAAAQQSRRLAQPKVSAATPPERQPAIDINAVPRMIALDAQGNAVPVGQHAVVHMPDFGLMFDARPLVKHQTHKAAMQAAEKCDLLSFEDWTAGTLKEQLLAFNRARIEPAAFVDYFPHTPKIGWLWSKDSYASDSSYAWGVGFHHGHVYYNDRNSNGFVRAVRRVPSSQS